MRMDLSHFKKISEDHNSATLMHPQGHQIKISKYSLGSKLKEQLSSLPMYKADGGEVEDQEQNIAPSVGVGGPMQAEERAPAALGVNEQNIPLPVPHIPKQEPSIPQAQNLQNYNIGTPSQRQPSAMLAPSQDVVKQMQTGFGLQQKGLQQAAQAQAVEGKTEAQAADKYMQDVQVVHDSYQKQFESMNQEIQNTIKDIQNSHIDPSHYMASKSSLGKISTAVGLILGGIGGGLTGQENPALKFLNANIDRDLNSQVADLGKKNNILGAYFKQTGNLHDAMAMTRSFYNDLYATQIAKAAAIAKSPMAQANANQAIGQLKVQSAQILGPLAMRNAVLGNVSGGQVDPSIAARFITDPKDKESAFKEVQKFQESQAMRSALQSSFDDLRKKALAGAFSPNDRNSAIQAFAGPIAKMAEGRFNLQEAQNQADALLPGRTDSAETLANKQRRLDTFFDTFQQSPVMDSYYGKILRNHPKPRPIANVPSNYNKR